MKSEKAVQEVLEIHSRIKGDIKVRLNEFRTTYEQGAKSVFKEYIFCILTPQSKARSCWKAVNCLFEKDLLTKGEKEIAKELRKWTRFHNQKAINVVLAVERFGDTGKGLYDLLQKEKDVLKIRDELVKTTRGMGTKEASHFLRNIGKGDDLAILDRHILKNLVRMGIIEDIPVCVSPKKYLQIEENMKVFSMENGIPMDHLDLVLWYMEAKEIFK